MAVSFQNVQIWESIQQNCDIEVNHTSLQITVLRLLKRNIYYKTAVDSVGLAC